MTVLDARRKKGVLLSLQFGGKEGEFRENGGQLKILKEEERPSGKKGPKKRTQLAESVQRFTVVWNLVLSFFQVLEQLHNS